MEKIKINLSKKTLNDLLNDMTTFEYYKKNGEINKNGFINTLLKNYFTIYDNMINSHIDTYTKILSNHIYQENKVTEIVNDLIKEKTLLPFDNSKNIETSISFKLINSNYSIFRVIENKYLAYQSISSFFRNLIESYLSLPKYKREQIIYLPTYELLTEAINDKRKIKIYLKNENEKEILPYKVSTNKEEIYNYLVGLTPSKNKYTVSSIHLSRIEYIYLLKEKYTLEDEDINKLERVIENGAQFPYTNPCNAKIKLSNAGIKLYKKKYLNRPVPISVEDNIYNFSCSYDQLSLYFFSFGKEAIVLEPEYLKTQLNKRYNEAISAYLQEQNTD